MQVADIKTIHKANSTNHCHEEGDVVHLSVDGVAETKSTNISIDVYSLQFKGCKDIYPIRIVRPINKQHLDHQEQLRAVLQDVTRNQLKIEAMVADNPKRAFLRFSMQFSSKNGCEYCFETGVSFRKCNTEKTNIFVCKMQKQKKDLSDEIKLLGQEKDSEKIKTLQKLIQNLDEAERIAKKQKISTHVVWPANTRVGEQRTREKILEIVDKIESGIDMSPEEKKGIKGRSLLLDIEGFDFILGIQTEYMHLVALGLVKRLLELCFNIGESRPRQIQTKLASTEKFNESMKNVKFPKESSRRARKLDLSVMKAQEMRNILIFLFPLVTQCLSIEKEIKLWEMFAFMVRACILPENEYEIINIASIEYCLKKFYILYEQLYGVQNCTYSVHVFCSHLLKMRKSGPLTDTSAFKFEAFYAELRNSFAPGTPSVLKQMFQSIILRRILSHHVCKEKIFHSEKDTALECNSLIYVFENNVHVIYKIQSIQNDTFICHQIGNHPVEFQCTTMLNWASVGVYRKGGLSSVDVHVKKQCVAGKVIKVDKYLITCPANILREK